MKDCFEQENYNDVKFFTFTNEEKLIKEHEKLPFDVIFLDIEMPNNKLKLIINKAKVLNDKKEWIIKKPKTIAGERIVEFPTFVIEKVKSWKNILTPGSLTNRFAKLVKKCNIQHCRFHDLRHYHASILHALGVPDSYIMQRGGWSSIGVLNDVYKHALSDKTKKFTDIATTHFEEMQHEMQHKK